MHQERHDKETQVGLVKINTVIIQQVVVVVEQEVLVCQHLQQEEAQMGELD